MLNDVYTAVRTWYTAECGRLTYWLGCVVAYLATTSSSVTQQRKSDMRKSTSTTSSSNGTCSTPPSPTAASPTTPVVDLPTVPSIVDLKRAIPKHCFEAQLSRSLYYVVKDLVIIAALYGGMLAVEQMPSTLLYTIYVPVYWLLQGTMFWAIFVLGHECGHNSFSRHFLLNQTLGTLLHTMICVPYYPWMLSHKHHHKNTGNIDRDEIFYPVRSHDTIAHGGKSTGSFLSGFGLGFGWFTYLIVGFSPRKVCHFNPMESMFFGHVFGCVASVLSLVAWAYGLTRYWAAFGTVALLVHYAVPIFIFGTWLVIVTFLHHMEAGVTWYGDKHWTNVRGQLSTVDRDYGWAHELTHNIGTHQIHHLFIKIPHYHLEEATRSFRQAFPHLQCKSDDAIIPSFFRNFTLYEKEHIIADDTQVHVWKKYN